jgi:nucleoside-diphosphate-sugar epimerase
MGEKREKEVVLLTGASGSMGFETFKLLWEQRDRYDMVLLLRPSRKNKRLFRQYERAAGIVPIPGAGVVTGDGLKIVWGDALNRDDVEESCRGIGWCLHTMALISPEADRNPDMAYRVNLEGTRRIVEAIEARDPENTRMVYIGSIAEYGDRMPPVHVGRTGDPLIPSVYDHYALSKIGAEQVVMQSRIRYKVSLRQTFIMIPDLFSLIDPILFHQPVNSFMEGITARDSGRILARCLKMPGDSDFWGDYYNISGGPACRSTFLDLLQSMFGLFGVRYQKVMERRWFALKNFHMHFFGDADRLNSYLHHWEGGTTMEEYTEEVRRNLAWYLKAVSWFSRYIPPFRWVVEGATWLFLWRLSMKDQGTTRWIRTKDEGRIRAFYGSMEAFKAIGDWGENMPSMDPGQPFRRLDHGYDESREVLGPDDLREAARFRGGELEGEWNGGMHEKLGWKCCRGHTFEMTPHAVLKGGHWCPECIAPPWDYAVLAEKNPFAAQVLS